MLIPKQVRTELTESIKYKIRSAACHKCELCTEEAMEVHHIVPVEEGGQNTEDNLIALCANCHRKIHIGKIRNSHAVNAVDKRTDDHKYQISVSFQNVRPKRAGTAEKKAEPVKLVDTVRKGTVSSEEKQANIVESIRNGARTKSAIYKDVGMSQNTRDNLQILIDKGIVLKDNEIGYVLAKNKSVGSDKKPEVVWDERQSDIIKSVKNGAETLSAICDDVGLSQKTRDNLQILVDKGMVVKSDKGRYCLAENKSSDIAVKGNGGDNKKKTRGFLDKVKGAFKEIGNELNG